MESYEGGKFCMVRALGKGNTKTANPANHCCFLKAGYELWSHLAWGMLVSVIAFRPYLIIGSGVGMVHSPGIFHSKLFAASRIIWALLTFTALWKKAPKDSQ